MARPVLTVKAPTSPLPFAAARAQAALKVKQADAALPSKPLLSIKAKPGSAIATKQALVKSMTGTAKVVGKAKLVAPKPKPSTLDQAANVVTHVFHSVYPQGAPKGAKGSGGAEASIAPGIVPAPSVKIVKNAFNDAADIATGTVPSLYHLGTTVAGGHLAQAGHMLAAPYVQLAKHPGQTLENHPLQSFLLVRGGVGAVDRAAGKVMRATPINAVKEAASPHNRPALEVPGTGVTVPRQYSKGPLERQVQKAVDRSRVAGNVKAGRAPLQASAREVKRRVAEDVQAAKIITAKHAGATQKATVKVLGKKPNAAVTLAAQGITNGSHADLLKYHDELVAAAGKLKGPDLHLNERTRSQIQDALKQPEQPALAAALRYQQHAQGLESKVLAAGLVKPVEAENARLAGVAVRKLAASPETRRQAAALAKVERTVAQKNVKQANRVVLRADKQLQKAHASARVSVARVGGVAPAPHDRLLGAIEAKDQAKAIRNQARVTRTVATQKRRELVATPFATAKGEPIPIERVRAAVPVGQNPAFVSHARVRVRTPALPQNKPTVPIKEARTGEAVRQGTLEVHPAKLIAQATDTQRLLDAADARNHFIDQWAYRAKGKPPEVFPKKNMAENVGRQLTADTGQRWAPIGRQDGSWALVPHEAWSELGRHEHASANPLLHPAIKAMSAQWRRNVLVFSPKWLAGNTVEAAFRSLVGHAGVTSYITAKKLLGHLDKNDPALAEQLRARAISGGHFAAASRDLAEAPGAEALAGFAKAAHAFATAPIARNLGDLYGKYTNFVFNSLNGRLETQFQTAMLGKTLRDSNLMPGHVVKLSQAAMEQAAKGLTNTNEQVALGRAVDRMYGQYGKFSPGKKAAIATYTPFIAWTSNAAKFLTRVLPNDHPVLTSLLTAQNQASYDWRKQAGIVGNFFGQISTAAPSFLQGSAPTGHGLLPVSKYTPYGVAAGGISGLAGLFLPQFSEIIKNVGGHDWKDKPLSKTPSDARSALAAATSLIEGQIPLASAAANVSGVRLPNKAYGDKINPSLGARAKKQLVPFLPLSSNAPAAKGTSSSSGWDFSGAGGGSGFDFSPATSSGWDFSGG